MSKILFVEDDLLMAGSLKNILAMKSYRVDIVGSCREAFTRRFSDYDLFIVDIGLPDGDGITLCREIRRQGRQPILVLTAYESEDYVVAAFEAGADDYVVKPFRGREILARMEALLRRTQVVREVRGYRSGGLFVSSKEEAAEYEGQTLRLTTQEYRLLLLLLRYRGSRVSTESALQVLWSEAPEMVEENTLYVHISRLRKKLEKVGCAGAIETGWKSGYRWTLPVEAVMR